MGVRLAEPIASDPAQAGSRSNTGDILKKAVTSGSKAKAILFLKELRTAMEAKGTHTETGIGLLNYFFALGALTFTCKYIDQSEITSLLHAVGISSDEKLLERMSHMHYDNYGIYLNSIYFLISIGKKPDIGNISLVMASMKMNSDIELAGRALQYFEEFSDGKVPYEIPIPERNTSVIFNKMAQMIFSLSSLTSDFVSMQIDMILSSEQTAGFDDNELLYCLAIIGLLTYSGKETSLENITDVMYATDLKISKTVMESLQGLHISAHVFYLAAIYFIKAVGQDASMDKIIRVAKTMGIATDYSAVGAAISFYKSYGIM